MVSKNRDRPGALPPDPPDLRGARPPPGDYAGDTAIAAEVLARYGAGFVGPLTKREYIALMGCALRAAKFRALLFDKDDPVWEIESSPYMRRLLFRED